MKIAICQINTTVADFKGNLARVSRALVAARKKGASLAVFPEMVTFGYPPRDLLERPYLIQENLAVAEKIAKQSTRDFGIVFGMVQPNSAAKGRGLYNAAAFAFQGKICAVQAKTLLPTYDVFDEARHFDAAVAHEVFSFQGVSFGLTVCEDIWFDYDYGGKKYYEADPVALLKASGADVILNISASPFALGKREIRRNILTKKAEDNGVTVVYCNLVGGNDELVFDGQSLAVGPEGKIFFEGKSFKEEITVVDIEKKTKVHRLAGRSETEDTYNALVLGLSDYARKCGFSKAVVGLSGGIDSSVVAALAAKALGNKNVLGILMPSPYSTQHSVKDALRLAKNLKMRTETVPIGSIYAEYLKQLNINLRKGVPLAAENLQARIRGNILMARSNKTGALVLSTGNKSELACGYCTLYGDMAGGLALISDISKTNVYGLARFINRQETLIPTSVIRKAPSAELRPGQKDSDSLPPYPELDAILESYIIEHRSTAEIVKKGFSKHVVERVVRLVNRNEYKRRQAPPGIKVTSKAFGMGRRLPIARSGY